jgi:hypothetical protein
VCVPNFRRTRCNALPTSIPERQNLYSEVRFPGQEPVLSALHLKFGQTRGDITISSTNFFVVAISPKVPQPLRPRLPASPAGWDPGQGRNFGGTRRMHRTGPRLGRPGATQLCPSPLAPMALFGDFVALATTRRPGGHRAQNARCW